MKRVLVLAASAVLLGSVVTAASAQGGGGGRGQGRGGFGSMGLLRMEAVQTELKMTDAQKAKLDAKQQEMQQAMQELRPQGGGQPDPAEFQKMFQKIQELNDKAVADILDTTQLKRFHQLELQQAVQQGGGGFGGFGGRRGGGGAGAPGGGQNLGVFGRKGVAEALNLTDKQKADIAKIQDEAGQQVRDAMQGFDFQNASPEERQKMNEGRQKIQKDALDKSMAVLTDAQKTTWKGLLGEPFKFPAPQRRQPQA